MKQLKIVYSERKLDSMNFHILYNNVRNELRMLYTLNKDAAYNLIARYLHGHSLKQSVYLESLRDAMVEDAGHWQGFCKMVMRINKKLGRRARGYWTKREIHNKKNLAHQVHNKAQNDAKTKQ